MRRNNRNLVAILCLLLLVVLSCRKYSDHNLNGDIPTLNEAKSWYASNSKCKSSNCLAPKWEDAVLKTSNTGETYIVVPTSKSPKSFSSKTFIKQAFIFSKKENTINDGKIIKILTDNQKYKKENNIDLFADFKNKSANNIGNGAIVIFDINENYIIGNPINKGEVVRKLDADIASSNAIERNFSSNSNSKLAPIRNKASLQLYSNSGEQQNCTDWYYVTWNQSTGEIISETYVYTTCDNQNSGGSSSAPGTTAPPPPPCASSYHFVQKINADPKNLATSGGWQVAAIDNMRVKFKDIAYPSRNTEINLPRLYFGLPIYRADGTKYNYENAQSITALAVAAAERAAVEAFKINAPTEVLQNIYMQTLSAGMISFGGRVNTGSPGINITVPEKDVSTPDYPSVFGC